MAISSSNEQTILDALVEELNILTDEVMVFCPSCKAFQTLWFKKGVLIQTRKFTQFGKQIYHDCGTTEPCRLYLNV